MRAELGLTAFMPAMLMLAFRTRESRIWLCFGVPALVGGIFAIGTLLVFRRSSPEPFEFDSIEDLGTDVLGHVGSYLLAVVIHPDYLREEAVVAAIAVGLIVYIHIATGRVYTNPLAYLAGYRIYEASTSAGVTYYLFARTDVSNWFGSKLCVPLGQSTLVERPGGGARGEKVG